MLAPAKYAFPPNQVLHWAVSLAFNLAVSLDRLTLSHLCTLLQIIGSRQIHSYHGYMECYISVRSATCLSRLFCHRRVTRVFVTISYLSVLCGHASKSKTGMPQFDMSQIHDCPKITNASARFPHTQCCLRPKGTSFLLSPNLVHRLFASFDPNPIVSCSLWGAPIKVSRFRTSYKRANGNEMATKWQRDILAVKCEERRANV